MYCFCILTIVADTTLTIQVYQGAKDIDTDIKELVRTIRNAMKFIQNSTSVESVLAESQQTVEKLLRIIAKSIQSIHQYLDATKLGN